MWRKLFNFVQVFCELFLEEDSISFSRFLLGRLLELIFMISVFKLVVNLDANQTLLNHGLG